MLTEAWVPDGSCLLTRALPLSFALSHRAVTQRMQKGSVTEVMLQIPPGPGSLVEAAGDQPRRVTPHPVTPRGENTPDVVSAWCHCTVCKETMEIPVKSQPLSAQFATSM